MSILVGDAHLERLFPAYVRLSSDGKISGLGPSLKQHLAQNTIGKDFFETFRVETPRKVQSVDGLTDQREVTLVARAAGSEFRLRGIVLRDAGGIWLLVGHVPDVNGQEDSFLLHMSDFSPADSSLDFLVAVHLRQGLLQDAKALVEELREKSEEAEALAHCDQLTGLKNRRGFFRRLDQFVAASRAQSRPFVVAVIDLDGFKPVNDIFGHAAGDQLLLQSGARIRQIAGPNACVGRLGGDEFGILMPDLQDEQEILKLGEEICNALAAPFEIKEGIARIGASVGFAAFPQAGDTPETLFERADYALYHSKQHNRGRPILFTDRHEREIRHQSSIEHGLLEATDDEFHLVYQPIIRSEDGKAIGVEALARWTSPTLGIIPPDTFIRIAEHTGSVCRLTRILLKKALKDARAWQQPFDLSFNLSAIDISSPEAAEQLKQIVLDSGFPPNRLVFEITETAVMQDFDRAMDCLRLFTKMGIRIALDDFGTGYSSLGYLQKMPINRLKIDRSFTRGLATRHGTRSILQSIVGLCKNLKIDCVVEGVSNAAQARVLTEMGAPHQQGFFHSRAMTQAQLLAFLGEAGGPPVSHTPDCEAERKSA